nr:immunoglobulin heavy chain junction region [Macaca mulatta]
CANGITALDYL